MREIGLSILAKGSGGIVAIGVIYAWTQSLQAAVVGMGISWLIVLLTYDKANVRKLLRIEPPSAMPRSWLDLRAVWRVVLRCFPVAFSGTLKQLNVSIPRYFVQVYFGRAEVGYLAAINAFANFAIVLFRGVSQAASARLSRFHLEDRKRFVRLILKLLAISLLLRLSAIVGSLILGDWLLAVVYRFDYSEYAGVLTWMMLATLFALSATVLRTSMIAARRLIIQIPQLLLTTLVLAGACVVLVPYAGLYGAAWALLIAYFFESVSAAAIVVIHLREQTQQALSVGAESRAISRPALHEDAPSG
jgi:O-antigen/teichoic acid export membrane protein